jgi:hypothetical protein
MSKTRRPRPRRPRVPDEFADRLEKAVHVLWAPTPEGGVMLHNFRDGQFLELRDGDEYVWWFLDGTHSVPEIHDRLQTMGTPRSLASVVEIFERLNAGGFLSPRQRGGA